MTKIGNMLEEIKRGVIIQQVNAQGVMGSGIALAIRQKWPVVWDEYHEVFTPNPSEAESRRRLGMVLHVEVGPDLWVTNIVGQQFYGRHEPRGAPRYTSYDAVDEALIKVAQFYQGTGLSLNYPLLGSDRGGAHWPVIKALINHRLAGFEHSLWLLPGTVEPGTVNT